MVGMIAAPAPVGSQGLAAFHADFAPTEEGIFPTHSIKGDITGSLPNANFDSGLRAANIAGLDLASKIGGVKPS